MARLLDDLSNLTDPMPIFDPEDEDETRAKLSNRDETGVAGDPPSLEAPSKLRLHAATIFQEENSKYAGKRVSRKQLESSEDSEESSEESREIVLTGSDISSNGDVIRSDDDEELAGFKEKFKFQDASTEIFVNDDEASSLNNSDYENDNEDMEDDEEDEEDTAQDDTQRAGVEQFTKVNVEEEIQKGNAVRSQSALWDSLLESRIKLQKPIIIVNQLPQPDEWNSFVDEGGTDYDKALRGSESHVEKLLEQLIHLQNILLLQNPETKHLVAASSSGNIDKYKEDQSTVTDTDDEEIMSESDTEVMSDSDQPILSSQQLKRKMNHIDYPDFIAKRHKDFQSFRNSVIQKWYDKTRMASGKFKAGFSAFEQSALQQIDQILSDKSRLIKRTQLRRSTYMILGKGDRDVEEKDIQENQEEGLPSRDHLKEYDSEVFDDDDFYHQLLRELIDRKTSDMTDPVEISRQWLEIQKLRGRKKKAVDTKGSKGRKIRYAVHKKMVNYMAPVDKRVWSDEACDELFLSLFGKVNSTALHNRNSDSSAARIQQL